ncbi:hypothetical protein [Listeria booriae]|uniref:Uncharacterized protein n=1 Tax=Listeria booriae TaxID=1552123 RepID=A0A842FEJ4_9LIST|nr:hypothetical protein [Listeria booriae]MBC2242231.1 hypothetical protein [Listeria booriae]
MTEIIKTFEIIDADQDAFLDFEKAVKRQDIPVYQIKNRVLIAITDQASKNKKIIEELERYAFDLDLDFAKVKLVYLNAEAGVLDDSQSAIANFAKEHHVEAITEGMPLSLLPELIEFVEKKKGGMEEEEKQLFSDKEVQIKAVEEVTDEFIDDMAVNKKSVPVAPEAEKENPLENAEVAEAPVIVTLEQEETGVNTDDSGDYLIEKAKALFETSGYIRLPRFDELTHKKLHEQVLQAQFAIARAKGDSIQAIYERIKSESEYSIEQVETAMMKNARNAHEDALNRIDKNLKIEINQLLTERDVEYEQNRERYIQSQIPVLKKQYDAEHFRQHQSVLDTEIDMLKKRSFEEMAEEKARFAHYVDQVFTDSKENVMNTIRVDDIIEKYNAIAEEQREVLIVQAKSVQTEIGTTVSKIVKERDELKEELERRALQVDKQVAREKERVQQEVGQSFAEKEQQLVQQNKAELDQAYSKEQALLRQIEVLEKSLASEQEDKKLIERRLIEPAQEQTAAQSKKKGALAGGGTSGFSKIGIIISSAALVILLAATTIGIISIDGVKQEVSANSDLQESIYLEQLQANKKYEKAASTMKERGYSNASIARMYFENDQYIAALKTDPALASDFYANVAKRPVEEQKNMLGTIKEAKVLGGKQENALNVRLAILNKDEAALTTLLQETTDETAKVAVHYYMDQKKYAEADQLLKKHHDAKLSKELEKARQENVKIQLANTQKDIEVINQKIAEAAKKDVIFKKELAAIQKAKGDAAKVKAKQKQITDNAKQKAALSANLQAKQVQKKELEKDL